ncbi:MAG TPA: phospholipid carrier-dependent glycosyltransferase [Candidatus Paceibacterota bacterium]|nr:phospholipid carrier-dependent glycosyltransferase [Candidatus Paceibacterota bacterium]
MNARLKFFETPTFWLGLLVLISAGLHFYDIARPAGPVFDEAHFATYAAQFATGEAHFDIHPPLGKLMYAAVLRLTGYAPPAADRFLTLARETSTGPFTVVDVKGAYGPFPYVPLRAVSALFGIALPLVLYWFLRSFGVGRAFSLVGAALVVLETGLLTQTRLILLDGMFLFFGFLALVLFFKKRPFVVAGGVLWGIALAVKFTAIIFLAPVVMAEIFDLAERRKVHLRDLFAFVGCGALVFGAMCLVPLLIFSPSAIVSTWTNIHYPVPAYLKNVSLDDNSATLSTRLAVIGWNTYLGLSNYSFGVDAPCASPFTTGESCWYHWLLDLYPKPYFADERIATVFWFNPGIVVLGETAAILALLELIRLFHTKFFRARSRNIVIALGAWAATIFAFFFVARPTYIYHALPTVLWEIVLIALVGEHFWHEQGEHTPARARRLVIVWLAVFGLGGFLLALPGVYGAF